MKRKIRRMRGKATTESRVQETAAQAVVTLVDVETGQRFQAERTGDFVAYSVEVQCDAPKMRFSNSPPSAMADCSLSTETSGGRCRAND